MPPRPSLAPPRVAALAACLSCVSMSLQAQTTLPEVVVTGNPLGSAELATPATVLREPALGLRRANTLGEALDGLPGISQTGFGPNASRPVIRGLDGDRIRILRNGAASFDASGLSFDHAVPLDPLVVDRIEVLRGPAALMFGGQAVGGVVNLIDNRIPRAPLSGACRVVPNCAPVGPPASRRAPWWWRGAPPPPTRQRRAAWPGTWTPFSVDRPTCAFPWLATATWRPGR